MAKSEATTCAGCQRLQAEVDRLRGQLVGLEAVVARLQEQLAGARKDSSTSSKPPSSDIVKPAKPTAPDGQPRKQGGQPGHPKHERVLFPPEQVHETFDYLPPDVCPDCGGPLQLSSFLSALVQQVDLAIVPMPLRVEEHRCHQAYCDHCDEIFRGVLPPAVQQGGLVGPRLTALVAYLKGVCHASFSTIRTFLRDVAGLTISRGQLVKVIAKVSAALEQAYQELLDDLPHQATLNVDETGHKDRGDLLWTWCFRAELYTLFKIDPTRSADVLLEVLGKEFDGVLGCDFYGAYRKFMRLTDARLQFCLAHLVREVKFLCTLPDKATREYGERFRQALRELFGVIHQRERYSKKEFDRRLAQARQEVMFQATAVVPNTRAAQRLASRMEKHGAGYFVFLTTPDVGPTNNAAEQAIRFVVIDRKVTQGTRGEKGQRTCERLWTVIASCAQQGRSVWEFLVESVQARFAGGQGPSLLPVEG